MNDEVPADAVPPHRFWVSWYEPVNEWHLVGGEDQAEYLTPNWPDGIRILGEWVSGLRCHDDAQTVCAVIEAPSRAAVKAALEAEKREIRFISWREHDWQPAPDRFPPC